MREGVAGAFAGAAVGAGIKATIGGVGVAAMGTAVALPVVPVAAALGLAGGLLYGLGRRRQGPRRQR